MGCIPTRTGRPFRVGDWVWWRPVWRPHRPELVRIDRIGGGYMFAILHIPGTLGNGYAEEGELSYDLEETG